MCRKMSHLDLFAFELKLYTPPPKKKKKKNKKNNLKVKETSRS